MTGTIKITSTWTGSTSAQIIFRYDVAGTPIDTTLQKGVTQSFTTTTSGKILVYIQFINNPNGFSISLTMPNGDVYALVTSTFNNYNPSQNNQLSSTACLNDYNSNYKTASSSKC